MKTMDGGRKMKNLLVKFLLTIILLIAQISFVTCSKENKVVSNDDWQLHIISAKIAKESWGENYLTTIKIIPVRLNPQAAEINFNETELAYHKSGFIHRPYSITTITSDETDEKAYEISFAQISKRFILRFPDFPDIEIKVQEQKKKR